MTLLYPRTDSSGKLVAEDQLVDYQEHLRNKHRVLFATGQLSGDMSFADELLALDSLSSAPIKIVITSGGGLLDTTFLLYDMFKLMRSPIYTIGRYCASAGTLLLAAGKKRYLFPHAKVMLHLPSAQLAGDTRELSIQHKETENYREEIVRLLQECGVNRTRRQILKDIDREYWLEPRGAIEYGLADEIVSPKVMAEWLGGNPV